MESTSAVNRSVQNTADVDSAARLFDGGGQAGELMATIDWARTPVGPVESWPQSLKTAISVMLKQKTAVFIFWGPEHVQFYNDAYRPILGTKKHPAAMGQRGSECWPEIWDIIRPLLETVHRGESTAVEDGLLLIDRTGYLEEGYYTYSFSPVAEESGTVGGVFCIVHDTTVSVIGERRLRTLRDLASRTMANDAEEACRSAIPTLAANPYDVPFAALYLYDNDRKSATLAGVTGSARGAPVSPKKIEFGNGPLSVIARAASLSRVVELPNLAQEIGPLPGGAWPVGADSGIVLPLAIPGQMLPAGFLVAGINPRKRLDARYKTFFELVAGQIGVAIAEARAYETERNRAESLAELDRAKTSFFSNVSHEFRTPLTLMLGPLADILSKPGISIDECREELAVAHRNCTRLLKLVNTLLDFSRIEAGGIQARYEATDLPALTADLASMFRSAIERAHLKLIVNCPSLGEPVFVDREMWEKIVLNLLSNALKFTLKGEIEVALRRVDGRAVLTVRDTGVGIPESQIARVFQRFQRIEGGKGRSQGGSGIGLALVQELARLHGGNVSVISQPGKGSTFTVALPLGSGHLPQEGVAAGTTRISTALGAEPFLEEALRWLPDESPASASLDFVAPHQQLGREKIFTAANNHRKQRARILIVDDNSDMRDYLRRLLGGYYDVLTAPDGAAAIEALRNNRPDLVLADVMMPGMDGFELLQAVRKDPALAAVPVILVSARAGEEARVEGLAAGADDYIVKPFSARELLVRVASRLEIAGMRKDAADAEFQNLRNLIQHAPAAVALVAGPDHVFRLVNDEFARYFARSQASLGGQQIGDGIPEFAQGFKELLDGVYQTGKPFTTSETLVRLDREDGPKDYYFNFAFQPWNDAAGQTQGVFLHAVDITEQVAARQRLEESIAARQRVEAAALLLGAIVESSDDPIISKDLSGIITSWNQAAERVFGYTAQEVIGKSITIIIPEDRLSEEAEILGRLKRGLRVDHFETIRRRKDGSLREISLTISPVKDGTGRIVGASKIARDITERKRAEEAIRVLNDQLTSDLSAMTRMQQLSTRLVQAGEFPVLLGEIIDAGIEITHADMGHIQLFEGGALKIVAQRGFEPRFAEFFDRMPNEFAAWGAALKRGQRVIVEDVASSPIFAGTPALEVMLETGARAVQSTPLVSRSGELVGVFSTHYLAPRRPDERDLRMLDVLARQAADLVERLRAEEALRQSEARFRELAEVGPQFIWVCRPDGAVEYVNQRWLDYSGVALTAASDFRDAIHPEDFEELMARWERSRSTGETLEMEARLRRADGAYRWFVIRSVALRDQSGQLMKWFGASTDIDDQKQVEAELRRVNQDLEQFAYSASHDLQEPLRNVKIYSELLIDHQADKLDPQALEFLDYIRGGASRMEILIRDLLAYTQVTKLEAPVEAADASEAVREILIDLKQAIDDTQARITYDPLPRLRVHRTHLKQLFQNLIGNALKYRSPERRPEVHIGAERLGSQWIFSVRDNGLGIEPEYHERIFGLFKRLHRGNEYSGTGIGLAICQRIVERYHGRIWVDSEPGFGATFLFVLPA